MPRIVEVTAPSRLHFGLWAFGDVSRRQFGGVGAMIDQPGLRLQIRASDRITACGPEAPRALEFAKRFIDSAADDNFAATIAAFEIKVLDAPRAHVGFGSGTQMALAVATGLNAWI